MPYRIEKIVVEGFRGFRKKKELKFDQGLVIFFGPQRSGKSSVLNAPVWALIGPEATKVNLGPVQIRERVGWLVENLKARDCRVEVVLRETGGDTLSIERRKGRDKCTVSRNGCVVGETPLAALRLTLDGLVSSVFLPQEVVRAALSVEPRYRRAIFTQLVGLEDLRALEECFKNASETLEKTHERVAGYREKIDTSLKAQVSMQKDRIKELSEKVRTLGLSAEDVSPEGMKGLVGQSVAALREFCSKCRMEVPTLPAVAGPDDLPGFVGEVRSALSRFEARSPETERQKELYRRKHAIEGLIADQREIERKRKEIDDERQTIVKAHGTEEDLKLAIEESEKALQKIIDELDRAGKYLRMIQEALAYFEALPEVATEIECPVCRRARATVAHVREHLAAEIEKAGLGPLRQRKKEIDQNLKQKQDAQERLLRLAEQDEGLKKKREGLGRNVSELRGQPLGPHESLELVLKGIGQEVKSELKKLEGLLEARGEAIQEFRKELEKFGVAGELHRERQRLARLDDLPNLPEYRALVELETKVEGHLALLSELGRGMKEEVEQAFREKFAALKEKVNELYRRLVGREDFPEIWIDVADWEVLAGAGDEGTGVTRVFNVGDMTAVALSLFLASAVRAIHDAGFILLDDPTQSLDEEHETRLADILAELAGQRQVVVTSSRTSFLKALENAGTVKRQVIRLAAWDSDRSCRLEGEAPEG